MKRLASDCRGAVMVTGLFMATTLIGATWFLFGIAKALIFRERVQETADSAAFASAAIHAKGMNLIAAINLVFFALTAVWLVLRLVEMVLGVLQSTVTWNASNCHGHLCRLKACEISPLSAAMTASGAGGPAAACGVASGLQSARDVETNAKQSVGDFMWNVFPKLSAIQDATARLAPPTGTAVGLQLGDKFGSFTMAVSPSMAPVDDVVRKVSGSKTDPYVDKPLGLPVVPRRFGSLCGHAAQLTIGKAAAGLRALPVLGKVLALPLVTNVFDRYVGQVTGLADGKICGDDVVAGHGKETKIFREKGPKLIHPHAENGNDLMQVWAFTHGELVDVSIGKVAIAGRLGPQTAVSSDWYAAQAEFFFDCDKGWGDAACNGNDNASFSMRWNARLRRLRTPAFGKELGRYLRDALFSGPVRDALAKRVGVKPKDGEPQTTTEKAEYDVLDKLFQSGMDILAGKATDAAGIGNQETGTSPALH